MKKSLVLLLCATSGWMASATTFNSPRSVLEECRVLPPIPGGVYTDNDKEEEQEFCAVDFYDTRKIALCPKTWSTSPGTMIYSISKSNLSQREYEAQKSCGGSKEGHRGIAKFKQSMNQNGTSGTYSPSSLLYYHFSRYFDTSVAVPAAVYRTMDKDEHFSRVTKRAHGLNMGKSAMNKAGWKWFYQAEQQPSVYKPTSDLFTPDQKQIFGVILDGGGDRYGAEINGIRSKWGDAQNIDFQNTPAFLALRSEKPLRDSIKEGLALGMRNPTIAKSMGGGASDFQMAVWMKELTEITLMDYMFNQQDRIGNLDYKWYVYSVDANGKVSSDRVKTGASRAAMSKIVYPKSGVANYLVQRTQMGDNDAGGRIYVNYTKRTKMLEKIRHINIDTYRKLMALQHDFLSKGAIYKYLQTQFHIDSRVFASIVNNTVDAANIIKSTCKAGKLRFDLYPTKQLLTGDAQEIRADCDRP